VFYRFVLRTGPVERFVRFMASRGIDCKRPVFRPLHHSLGASSGEYPGAEELHRHWASIPLYPSLRREERELVALAVRDYLR
jgi:dTDP-4-amino-4,6-dideoxygalactose transaminase